MRYLILILFTLTAACATVGTNVTAEQAATIEPGMTRTEVVELLGKPNHAMLDPDGRERLMWIQATSKATAASFIPYSFSGGTNTETTTFTVLVENGVVVDSMRHEGTSQMRYGLGAN